jgi:hypothetical protein
VVRGPIDRRLKIAEQIGVHQTYVSRLREQVKTSLNLPDRVTGKDGKSYPASRNQHDEKRDAIRRDLEAGGSVHAVAKARGESPFGRALARDSVLENYSFRPPDRKNHQK